jgi:hypothetical protein
MKFKQLRNYTFNVLLKSEEGRRRDTKEILTRRGTSPRSAEQQLSTPTEFFFAAMPAKCTSLKSASEEVLGTASARKTSGPKLHRLVIQLDSSGGCGGHGKVEAQVGATKKESTTYFISEGVASSKGLATNLNCHSC